MAKKQDFVHPMSAAALRAAVPAEPPSRYIRANTIPDPKIADRQTKTAAAMVLVMSHYHGNGRRWKSVPFHMLFANWLYNETGIWVKQGDVVPQTVPPNPPPSARSTVYQDPDTVTRADAEISLATAINALIRDDYVSVVRHDGSDHIFPTEKLVEALKED